MHIPNGCLIQGTVNSDFWNMDSMDHMNHIMWTVWNVWTSKNRCDSQVARQGSLAMKLTQPRRVMCQGLRRQEHIGFVAVLWPNQLEKWRSSESMAHRLLQQLPLFSFAVLGSNVCTEPPSLVASTTPNPFCYFWPPTALGYWLVQFMVSFWRLFSFPFSVYTFALLIDFAFCVHANFENLCFAMIILRYSEISWSTGSFNFAHAASHESSEYWTTLWSTAFLLRLWVQSVVFAFLAGGVVLALQAEAAVFCASSVMKYVMQPCKR